MARLPPLSARIDEDVRHEIDDLRASMRPIPTISEVLRDLLMRGLRSAQQERREGKNAA